jgi:hypothetical protein
VFLKTQISVQNIFVYFKNFGTSDDFPLRIIQEIVTYFGKFAKIQEIIALTAQNVQEATKQIITTPPTIKMKLRVDISNPYLVVPRSSEVKDQLLLLDLGKGEEGEE